MKTKDKARITDEDIEKAFEDLAEEAEIEKAEDDSDEEELEDELEDQSDEEESDEEESDEEEVEDEEEDVEKAEEEEEEEEEEVKTKKKKKVNPAVKKGIEVSDFLKGLVDEMNESNSQTREVLGNVAIVVKGLSERLDDMEEQFQEISSLPRQAKSKIKKANVANRFAKSVDEEAEEEDNNILGLRSDYKRVLNALDDASGLNDTNGKIDMEFAKAIQTYEARKILPTTIIDRLKKEKNIIIDATR